MEMLTALWIPILISAVAVWITSAIAWMALGHHNKDFKSLPTEAERELKAWVKKHNVESGVYGYPNFHESKNRPKEEMAALMKEPMGMLRVWALKGMAKPMIYGFLFMIFICVLIGYLGYVALPRGTEFMQVFRVLGTAGVLAHCCGGVIGNMWFQESKRAMVLNFIDGVVYGLITGAVFAWLWPK